MSAMARVSAVGGSALRSVAIRCGPTTHRNRRSHPHHLAGESLGMAPWMRPSESASEALVGEVVVAVVLTRVTHTGSAACQAVALPQHQGAVQLRMTVVAATMNGARLRSRGAVKMNDAARRMTGAAVSRRKRSGGGARMKSVDVGMKSDVAGRRRSAGGARRSTGAVRPKRRGGVRKRRLGSGSRRPHWSCARLSSACASPHQRPMTISAESWRSVSRRRPRQWARRPAGFPRKRSRRCGRRNDALMR
mmetsp:Transcript_47621/g.120032  ORF Transcript_47621/g.120032 Transcript_47621/m.120032 type:complete len:249 (+) Transcript_47621:425-1171(+)